MRDGPEPAEVASVDQTPTPHRRHGMMLGLGIVLAGGAAAAGLAVAVEPLTGAIVGVLAAALGVQLVALSALVLVAPPGFAIVLSGRRRPGPDGRDVGFRVISGGGRVVRMPIIETFALLDLRPQQVSGRVTAWLQSNLSVEIDFTASIKMAGHSPRIEHAIERFLGRDLAEMRTVGKETIAGQVRACAADRSLDELQTDTERFVDLVIEASEPDLDRCGILIDTLAITPPTGVDGED